MIVSHVDEIPTDYAKALDAAKTLDDLRTAVKLYGEVAIDAVEAVERMMEDDFEDWRHALAGERKGIFMGEDRMEKFGDILMPGTMMKISIFASQFHVPWGLAYNRLKQVGKLKIKDGVAEVSL
jgi:hypothetical protein